MLLPLLEMRGEAMDNSKVGVAIRSNVAKHRGNCVAMGESFK